MLYHSRLFGWRNRIVSDTVLFVRVYIQTLDHPNREILTRVKPGKSESWASNVERTYPVLYHFICVKNLRACILVDFIIDFPPTIFYFEFELGRLSVSTRKHSQTNALNVQKRVKQLELAFLVHVQLQLPPSPWHICDFYHSLPLSTQLFQYPIVLYTEYTP